MMNNTPSQKTAKPQTVKCEVLRGIGMPPDEKTIQVAKERAKRKNIKFDPSGLTTMVFPNKDYSEDNGKTIIKAEPVFVDLDTDTARKLQKAGAVMIAI